MAEPELVGDVQGQAVTVPIHITNRLTVSGKNVTSFAHSYWTDAAPQARVCSTPQGRLQCSCGLFTLVWARG